MVKAKSILRSVNGFSLTFYISGKGLLLKGETMGLGDMKDMLSQMKNAQKQVKEIQKSLETMKVTSETGGGTVKVTVNGELMLVDLVIDPSLLNEKELQHLPNLIKKATQDAQKKAKKEAENRMKGMAGGLKIPGMP